MSDAPRAFISFLLCEAKQAEERARSLRATAAAIEAKNTEARRKARKKRKRTCETNAQSKPSNTQFFQDNNDVVKKNKESDDPKKGRSQMLAGQWGELLEHQYKNDYHTEHRDKKPK